MWVEGGGGGRSHTTSNELGRKLLLCAIPDHSQARGGSICVVFYSVFHDIPCYCMLFQAILRPLEVPCVSLFMRHSWYSIVFQASIRPLKVPRALVSVLYSMLFQVFLFVKFRIRWSCQLSQHHFSAMASHGIREKEKGLVQATGYKKLGAFDWPTGDETE